MNDSKPVFIADSCIGGLSVVKSLWASGSARRAIFMADYAINPLGLKSDSELALVANHWLKLAASHSDTLIMACNTLSIRYHQLLQASLQLSSLENVISMVDCFKAMLKAESQQLANRKVLVIGTEFTANQDVYPDLLRSAIPGVQVSTAAATALERKIARFQSCQIDDESVINPALRQAMENTDYAVLACTCFPMVMDRLESLFPGMTFLDPAQYCAGLLKDKGHGQHGHLALRVTGEVVSKRSVSEFAKSYLQEGSLIAE